MDGARINSAYSFYSIITAIAIIGYCSPHVTIQYWNIAKTREIVIIELEVITRLIPWDTFCIGPTQNPSPIA